MKSLFKHLLSQKKPTSGRLGSDGNRQKSPLSRCYPALKLLVSLPPILLMWTLTSQKALGQQAVNQLNTTYTNNGGDTSGNYSIQGVRNSPSINQHKFNQGTTNDLRLTSFLLSGQQFNLIRLVNRMNINRLDNSVVTGKREILFYERGSGFSLPNNLNVKPSAVSTMEQALLSDIINRGTDNIFGNQGSNLPNITTDLNNNNIERVDFVETAGLVAPSTNLDGIGFLVLERGANDGFKIAAITAIDAAGKPTAFGPLITATVSNWGAGTNINILTEVMRKNPADANLRYTDSVPQQSIGAIYFSYESLGVNPNQTIYGYSLFPPDITITQSSDLVNINSVNYPTNTNSNTDGGLDLIAGGGVFLRNTIQTDLEIAKTDNVTTITPGSNTTYTITVKNNGPTTVNSLTVQDTPPASLQNVQFTPSTGSYNSTTGEWTGLNLAPNQSVVLTMTGTVSASASGVITNTATVSPPSGVVDSNNTNNSSTDTTNVVSTVTGKPNLLLVKRITALNNGITTIVGDNLGVYLNEPNNPYDDNTLDNPAPPQQPDTQFWANPSSFLIGGVNGGNVRPGDELEYTIYFLSAGQAIAKNVLICDRVPDNVSFIPTAFNSNPPQATGGIPNADRGIVISYNSNTVSLTGVMDGDAGVYFPPGVDPTTIYPNINCNGANTNGTVVVNLGDLPFATASGVPLNSYGFIRFRGSVK